MKPIALVIWILGWLLLQDVSDLLQAKRRRIEGKPPLKESERPEITTAVGFICVAVSVLIIVL